MDQSEKFQLRYKIGTVFTPAAPINGKALFAGRTVQVGQVINATSQRCRLPQSWTSEFATIMDQG